MAAIALRRDRVDYWNSNNFVVRKSTYKGYSEAGLWFRTRGCTMDRMGNCTMCNYSGGPETSVKQMISYVEQGLQEIPEKVHSLLISPSGSFMDELEVPAAARDAILQRIYNKGCHTYSLETRSETISEANVSAIRRSLGDREVLTYMGLETASQWVSMYSLNKGLDIKSFTRSTATLDSYGIHTIANVLLGAPFLSQRMAIEDTLNTIDWALTHKGVKRCCLFPVNIKKNTVIDWLFQKRHYSPPSLWSLVDVLLRLGPEVASNKIEIAWYTSYGSGYVIHPPDTCPKCRDQVISLLDVFVETCNFSIIEELAEMACLCKEKWKADMSMSNGVSPHQMAREAYDELGDKYGGEWWVKNRVRIFEKMRAGSVDAFTR